MVSCNSDESTSSSVDKGSEGCRSWGLRLESLEGCSLLDWFETLEAAGTFELDKLQKK